MRWTRAGVTRPLRLAYCLNLHPAEELEGVLAGLADVTVPLAARLRAEWNVAPDAPFGVGPWLAGELALGLARELERGRRAGLERLAALFAEYDLVPFTWNAFPYGGFHRPGLKRGVFRPTWAEVERLEYTLAVARVAVALAPPGRPGEHLSVSTHTGMWAADCRGEGDRRAVAEGLARCVEGLARLEAESGARVVLALEPEPRSLANDTRELAAARPALVRWGSALLAREFGRGADEAEALFARHLGTCLDTCHAAVEFEEPAGALERATSGDAPLAKLQFSSALELDAPGADAEGRARLYAMDEPVYLHQVTGRLPAGVTGHGAAGFVRATDLAGLRERAEEDPEWLACDRWRCHFHVPVDLTDAGGLGTTRAGADATLAAALAAPERWGTGELHLEIETYTWDVLPDRVRGAERGPAALVAGLAREYAHVVARLCEAGWQPDPAASEPA